jgi:hypothetical protein
MHLLQNTEEILSRIARIRGLGRDFSTNLYAMPDELQSWCHRREVWYMECDDALIVLRTDRDIKRLYHAAPDCVRLLKALTTLDEEVDGVQVSELLGRGDNRYVSCLPFSRSHNIASHDKNHAIARPPCCFSIRVPCTRRACVHHFRFPRTRSRSSPRPCANARRNLRGNSSAACPDQECIAGDTRDSILRRGRGRLSSALLVCRSGTLR